MANANHYASSLADAAAKTANGGTDLELGDQAWSPIANGGAGLLEAMCEPEAVSRLGP